MSMHQPPRPALAALLALALPLLASQAHATCSPALVQLGPATSFAAGVNPVGCVLADVNGDGKLDALVAISHLATGSAPGELAFLRGLGDGTFAPALTRSAGTSPLLLAAGDLNGDGILDAVVTNWATNTVSVLLGQGTGGTGNGAYGNPVAYPAGLKPHHLVLADLNHDGILDIVVNNDGAPSVTVLLGHGAGGLGDGTFGLATSFATSSSGTGVAVGDVNGDGIPDIVATESATFALAILLGNGSGGVGDGTFTFSSHVPTATRPYDVTLADLNGDGHLDVLITLQDSGGLWVRLGHGDGTFGTAASLTNGSPGSVRVVDFDGDGKLDLVVTQGDMNQVELLRGNGDGTFVLRTAQMVPNFPVVAAIGDLNGDGLPDVVAADYLGSTVSVLLGVCSAVPVSFQIDHVRDVPSDQGGKLWVSWYANARDVAGGTISGYRVWRRIPAAAAAARPAGALRIRTTAAGPVYWEAAATLPAQHLAVYGYTAATAQDSLAGGNPYTAFFVTATTGSSDLFYDTPVDSGYSVDNLAPAAPAQLTAAQNGNVVTLAWAPNTESDLYGYRVYRGTDRFFLPSAASLVGSPTAPHFTDTGTAAYYKVGAVDVHGNVGPCVLVEPAAAVGIDVGLVASDVTPAGVTLTWYADPRAIGSATLERDAGDGNWQAIVTGAPDGGGQLVLHDGAVTPGVTYRYRLAWSTAQGVQTSSPVTLTVPGLTLALGGASPNPATVGRLALWFSLPDGARATLELFDVGGRRVLQRSVGELGAGAHVLALPSAALSPGVYMARLSHGTERRSARVVIAP